MRRALPVLLALAVGILLGVLLARTDVGTPGNALTDARLWLVGAAVLAALARGPLTGALVGLAAMVGLLGTLELLPYSVPAGTPAQFRDVVERLLADTAWLNPALLAGAAVAGAAVGTIRFVLRTGGRVLLAVAAVVVVVAIVVGVPKVHDVPFGDRGEDITVIK